MGDFVKIGVKSALIAVITAAIIALFVTVKIPAVDFAPLTQGLGMSLAVLYHYVPVLQIIMPVVLSLLAFEAAVNLFHLAMIAVRWVMKVNE